MLVLAIFVAAVGIGFWATEARSGLQEYDDVRTILEIMTVVKRNYYEDVSLLDLMRGYIKYGTINGMLSVLEDPYTRYLPPHAYQQMKMDSEGEFEGIGIVVAIQDNELTIVGPIEGTPGFRAGLRGGDKIVRIDGKSTENMSLDEAVSLMRGPAGTQVVLDVRKAKSGEVVTIAIERANVKVNSVTRTRLFDDGIGYIRLSSFTLKSADELREAMEDLQKQGMKALILDLRGNPGGIMDSAVKVADLFISSGPLLHVVPREDVERPATYYAMEDANDFDKPVVVLVDQYSASASEIVAGALKDTGTGTVVGVKTFGKGLVQILFPLRNQDALSLTIARYQTAGGNDIHGIGVEPDVIVELPEGQDPPYFAISEHAETEDSSQLVNPENDPQLAKAIEILKKSSSISD